MSRQPKRKKYENGKKANCENIQNKKVRKMQKGENSQNTKV